MSRLTISPTGSPDQGRLRLADNDGDSKSIVSRHGRSLRIDEENPINLGMVNKGYLHINNF